ncbi:MAG: glycosyltransferase [Rhodocyclales bacterium GT-UBC]|nr:MAG: glycosyltransferase [Rhodocyclales bacterium GT-UBC]
MRILLLCDRYPNSYRDGLLLRVLHLAHQLKGRHRFDLLCYHDATPDGEPVALFERIWTVPAPAKQTSRGWKGMVAGWDPRCLYPRSEALVQLLETTIVPDDYDVVWDAGACLFLHLPTRWDGIPVVADLVDDMVLTFWRALCSTPGLLTKVRFFKYLSVNWLYERYCMQRVAHCVVVSDDDAESFAKASPSVPVSVVPNGVDIEFFTPSPAAERPDRLVFEGTMAFPPNQQAAQFLVHEIMPRIWAKRPDVVLTLVGRDPGPEVRALAGERVVVTGAVDDIRPYVQSAAVFVSALQSGAGIKNKLLQAWAMGKAVVATSLSIGGLGAVDGDNLLVRDGADEIADTVLALLDVPEKRRCLGERGRETVLRDFAWSRQANLFETILSSALAAKP